MTIPRDSFHYSGKTERLIDSSNPNIGDTTDASFTIILNISAMPLYSPVAGTRIEVSNSSTQSQDFVFGRGGTDPSITYKVKIKRLVIIPNSLLKAITTVMIRLRRSEKTFWILLLM
ncbi:MAG: hypothetical protein R2942_00755 [Ignavibacteria bacterium]